MCNAKPDLRFGPIADIVINDELTVAASYRERKAQWPPLARSSASGAQTRWHRGKDRLKRLQQMLSLMHCRAPEGPHQLPTVACPKVAGHVGSFFKSSRNCGTRRRFCFRAPQLGLSFQRNDEELAHRKSFQCCQRLRFRHVPAQQTGFSVSSIQQAWTPNLST
jgi:hypothetical protein